MLTEAGSKGDYHEPFWIELCVKFQMRRKPCARVQNRLVRVLIDLSNYGRATERPQRSHRLAIFFARAHCGQTGGDSLSLGWRLQ